MERLKCMARQCFITAYQSLPDDEVSLHGTVNYKKKVFSCVVLRSITVQAFSETKRHCTVDCGGPRRSA